MPVEDTEIGRNLARLRGEMSQKDVADQMRRRGFKWSQATVWSVERGERPLRLAEADALSEFLEMSNLYSLTSNRTTFNIRLSTGKIDAARVRVENAAEEVTTLQLELAQLMGSLDLEEVDDKTLQNAVSLMTHSPANMAYDAHVLALVTLRNKTDRNDWENQLLDELQRVRVTYEDPEDQDDE